MVYVWCGIFQSAIAVRMLDRVSFWKGDPGSMDYLISS